MSITVEIADVEGAELAEVILCFDEEGLELLIQKLTWLRGKNDHLHLMTEAWGGHELGNVVQGGDGLQIVNHLRLVKNVAK